MQSRGCLLPAPSSSSSEGCRASGLGEGERPRDDMPSDEVRFEKWAQGEGWTSVFRALAPCSPLFFLLRLPRRSRAAAAGDREAGHSSTLNRLLTSISPVADHRVSCKVRSQRRAHDTACLQLLQLIDLSFARNRQRPLTTHTPSTTRTRQPSRPRCTCFCLASHPLSVFSPSRFFIKPVTVSSPTFVHLTKFRASTASGSMSSRARSMRSTRFGLYSRGTGPLTRCVSSAGVSCAIPGELTLTTYRLRSLVPWPVVASLPAAPVWPAHLVLLCTPLPDPQDAEGRVDRKIPGATDDRARYALAAQRCQGSLLADGQGGRDGHQDWFADWCGQYAHLLISPTRN